MPDFSSRPDPESDPVRPHANRNPRFEIANAISRIQSQYYGKGPVRARAYMEDDLVVVVLDETFTRAEKTLISRGETDAIQAIRRRFQESVADEFVAIIEQVTGRKVRAFLSDTDVQNDISVETFLLAEDRTNMEAFEGEADGISGDAR